MGERLLSASLVIAGAFVAGCANEGAQPQPRPAEEAITSQESLQNRPRLVGRFACEFATGDTITPKQGEDAPAVWVYPGLVDTEDNQRFDRPIIRIEEGKEVYYSLEGKKNGGALRLQKIGKVVVWHGEPAVVNGAWASRVTSAECDTKDTIPPHGDAVTIEGRMFFGSVTAGSFNLGSYLAPHIPFAHVHGAVGLPAGKSTKEVPLPTMVSTGTPP